MSRWLLVLGLLVACSPDDGEQGSDMAGFDPFARPAHHEVQPGDTLFAIARDHGVTVDDLRGWNGLEGDLIEAGQVLLVWKGAGSGTEPTAARQGTASPSAPLVVAAEVETRPPPPELRQHGVFGAIDEVQHSDTLDAGTRAAVDGLQRHAGRSDRDRRGERSSTLGRGGTAEATDDPAIRSRPAGTSFASASVSAPSLPMPPRRRCLSGPSDVQGERGVAASQGLTAAQIRETLDPFVGHTATCIPAGSSGTTTVTTALTVGCDGRVDDARVIDRGDAPAGVARCVATTLRHAGFPAHALPDGFTFHYPVTFRF